MARIMGIDYGKKRCGIAVTDPLQIIVTGLDTIATENLERFLDRYFESEEVEKIVFGLPVHSDGNPTYLQKDIIKVAHKIKEKYPQIVIDYADESFSSVDAKAVILKAGTKKKKRRDKAMVDKVSAVIILQRYLHHI